MEVLDEILDEFMRVETGLTVEAPNGAGTIAIKRVYKGEPGGASGLETPCIFHQWRRLETPRRFDTRKDNFDIRVLLAVCKFDAATDYWTTIAARFEGAIVDAFDHDVMLGGSDRYQRILNQQEGWQPGAIDWNGAQYMAVELQYTVAQTVIRTFS